jgi:hypothetical protein
MRIKEIKEQAAGYWDAIFAILAPEFDDARAVGPDGHTWCPNPKHEQFNGDAFRLFHDYDETGGGYCNSCGGFRDGIALLCWCKGWSIRETVDAVAYALAEIASDPSIEKRVRPKIDREAKRRWAKRKLTRIWSESVPMNHQDALPVWLYLMSRGIKPRYVAQFSTLRCHPSLEYWHRRQMIATVPALVPRFDDADGRPATVHPIYLTADGAKADVPDVKKSMPICRERRGGAVRLGRPGAVLGVAEGVETALSSSLGLRIPVWATVSAVLMEVFQPPADVRFVVIMADLDRSGRGREAAYVLRDRLTAQGIGSYIALPRGPIPVGKKGVDWCDVYANEGRFGFAGVAREIKHALTCFSRAA